MQIKRLRLSGFKSFVDAVDLRVEPGLTGVVGPNGCGKSNLLEALRWTMGEASAKSLRGAGMDDVIFAGTATRPARDFAEVSILAEIAGEETEVVRRIERGAGSAYRIDGRDVRAKDVALLFADSATGAHSPALVSQNRIGAVIAAKPADRRAMLEEAAGIAGLHVRRKDAEQKLRATEANLQRLGEVIADQEARAAALRRQARQAERYRILSTQIRLAEARTIFARWRDAAAAADAAKAEAAAAETAVAEAAQAQRAAADDRTRAGEALTEARAAALAARDLASEAGHRLAALRAEQASTERRLAELTEGIGRIAADREREGGLASDAIAALDRLAGEARAIEAEIARAADALPALRAALADAERAARDGEVALAQALARRAGEAADTRIAEATLEGARSREQRLVNEVDAAEGALAALGAREPIERERDAAATARRDALAEAERARDGIAAADHADRDAAAARDAAQASRAALGAELAALDAEAAALAGASREPGGRRMLDRIIAAPGYERAVAAALGDDLDFGDDTNADTYWAGATPFADDPVVADDALAPFVEAPAALARRLAQVIVLDADDGRALATGQRLVTRAGAMRRWDGLVATSGAGAAAERLERRNRLTALAALRPAAAAAFAEAERAADAVDRDIAAARAARQAALDALARAEAAARQALQRGDRAAALLERLADQRGDIEVRLASVKVDRAQAVAEADRAEAALAALPDPSATTREVDALQRAVDERRAAAAEARAELATRERAAASARERRAAAEAEARSWRARADDAQRRIADLAAREAEFAHDREALAPRPAELDAEIAALAADYESARASADTLAANEHTAEAALRSAETAARDAGEALAAARETRAGAVARAENHELRRVETGRLAGERFECPVPVLPEKLGFAGESVRAPEEESSAHEKLTLDRDRIGPVNLVAEAELAELEASAEASAAEREELSQAVNRLRGSIGTLNREGRQRLLAALETVDRHFRRLFTTLFEGGGAHLALIDSDDPLEAGLEIMVQPPGKRLQSLTLLSGGEQALTAIALIFALFLTNPAPICVLDEVDAPLDDANIERFCDLLDRMTQETPTRYLIVTHNAVTMSRMHRLFGVTMIEKGVSRLVSVDLGGAEALAAE